MYAVDLGLIYSAPRLFRFRDTVYVAFFLAHFQYCSVALYLLCRWHKPILRLGKYNSVY